MFARNLIENLLHRVPRHFKVPKIIPKLLELIEDHQILPRLPQLPAFIENFFDVRFGPRGFDRLTRDFREPFESFLRHPLGQNRNGLASQQSRIIRATATVIPCGGPDRFLSRRVKLTSDQSRHETGKRHPDLVRSRREPLPHDGDDAGFDARQRGGKLEIADSSEGPA